MTKSNIFFTRPAIKQLAKIASRDRQRVLVTISKLAVPLPQTLDIKQLAGLPHWYRLRVGSLRVLFEVDTKQNTIWIRLIGYRGTVYGKL